MHGGRSPAIDVEIDSEPGEGLLYDAVVLVHNVLRRTALLAGLDGDGHSVLVRAADVEHVLAAHPEIPDIDIGRYIDAGKVADVNGTVGVRQRAGHQGSFVILFHIVS